MTDIERIRSALFFIPSDDRETWVRLAMAVKSELGDAGFELWDAWSQGADSYNAKDTRDVWRGINGSGGVTAGTLFHEAKAHGWRDDGTHQKPTAEELAERRRIAAERAAREEAEERDRHETAAARAAEILAVATMDPATHPYAIKKHVSFGPLVRRGLWPQRGWTDALLVPIYDGDGRLRCIEAINPDGDKDFLAGGRIGGGFHPLGQVRGAHRVLIGEGLASVAACVAESSPAVAALSASNLKAVALAVRKLAPEAEIIILADNDLKVPREAQDAALAVGGRVAIPELDGRKCDFWDLWHERGAEAVQSAIAGARAPDIEGTTAHEADEWRATVRRLAALPPVEYDRVRIAEAEALGVRASTLDAEVEKARKLAGDDNDIQGEAVLFPDIEPWPEPVDGAELLTDLAALFRCYAVLPEHAAVVALALWILFAHAIGSVNIAPILAITSPEKRCGKSTVLALLGRLVPRSLPAANISPAALFRSIEAWAPTLLIDEADSFLRNSEELRGILNSGHTRVLAFVIRTVGDDHEPRRFSTWGAKAIALIGKLPDTLSDRSIEIHLKRKLAGESVEKLRHADPELFTDLARRCARWAADHAEKIRAARPSMPDGLHDRAEDNWEPLLAIADLAGARWPDRAREAALALSGAMDVECDNIRVQLLTDIAAVFDEKGPGKLSSVELVEALTGMTERPWGEANRGRPITPRWLALRLRPFGITPKQLWGNGSNERGYLLEHFKDAFTRYTPFTSARPARTQAGRGFTPISQVLCSPGPSACENAQNPSSGAGPSGSSTCEAKQDWARDPEESESATAGERGVSENGLEPSYGAGCDRVTDPEPPPWGTRL